MIPELHQSIEEILRSASPEQRILWAHARLVCGENMAVRPFYFEGGLASSECFVYSPNKAYIFYEYTTGSANMLPSVSGDYFYTYDLNNAVLKTYYCKFPYWDATAAAVKYTSSSMTFTNIFCSRVGAYNGWDFAKIIGFRLTR